MWLKFEGLHNPLALDGAENLAPILRDVVRGWNFDEVPQGSGPDPLIRIERTNGGYQRTSPWLEGGKMVLVDPVDAVCDLLLDLKRAYIADTDKLLALHAAAVEFADGLTLFPSTHHAGKSTLAVLLAMQGQRIYADDMVALEPSTNSGPAFGVAPGFLPRLRKPLPGDLSPRARTYIDEHAGPESDQFMYVDPGAKHLAPLGSKSPIRNLVLLDRKAGAKVEFLPVEEAELLKHTIVRSLGRQISALELLDTLHAIVSATDGFRLTYERTEDAAIALRAKFGEV